MDWLTFISKIVGAIAWPAAIILVVWWLKSHIGQLVPLTKKLKYGDFEVEFDQQLAELKEKVIEQKTHHSTKAIDHSEIKAHISNTAKTSPRAAIVDAWVGLELTTYSSASLLGINKEGRQIPFTKLIKQLEFKGILQPKDVDLLMQLQRLRNSALHSASFHLTQKEVEEFAELARDLADLIAGECFQKAGGCGY